MDTQLDLFQHLESFIERSTPLQQLLGHLRLNVKFEIRVGKRLCGTLSKKDSTWKLSPELPTSRLATLSFSPEGIELLLNSNVNGQDELLELLFKIYLSEDLKIKLTKPLIDLLTTSSLTLARSLDSKLLRFLKPFGLESLNRKI